MNIITKSDVKKFLLLVKAGLKNGKSKELKSYTSITKYDGTDVPKEYYVSVEFRFMVDPETIDELFIEEDFDKDKDIGDLLNGL